LKLKQSDEVSEGSFDVARSELLFDTLDRSLNQISSLGAGPPGLVFPVGALLFGVLFFRDRHGLTGATLLAIQPYSGKRSRQRTNREYLIEQTTDRNFGEQ